MGSEEAKAIRRQLRKSRLRAPREVRLALSGGLVLFALYVALVAWLLVADPPLGSAMVRLFWITFVGGREAAMVSAYQPPDPAPPYWVAGMASLDDVSFLLMATAGTWYAAERLRGTRVGDSVLRAVDAALYKRRKMFARWGALALAVFLWLPGVGTGPVLAGAMGVLGRIRLRRLLPILGISAAGVCTFWAYSINGAIAQLPESVPIETIANVIIGLVILALAWEIWHGRKERHILRFEALTDRTFADSVRLARIGFFQNGRTFFIDARDVALRTGMEKPTLAECHWAARLMLLPSVDPAMAGQMARLHVTGRRDLLLLPAPLLIDALHLPKDEGDAMVARWKAEAEEQMAVPMPGEREE